MAQTFSKKMGLKTETSISNYLMNVNFMRELFKSLRFLLFMVPVALFAQNSVTGVVTEKATGMSIPGANIIVLLQILTETTPSTT